MTTSASSGDPETVTPRSEAQPANCRARCWLRDETDTAAEAVRATSTTARAAP